MNFHLIALFLEYSSAPGLQITELYHQILFLFFKNKHLAVPRPHFVSYILDIIFQPKQQNHAVMEATIICI